MSTLEIPRNPWQVAQKWPKWPKIATYTISATISARMVEKKLDILKYCVKFIEHENYRDDDHDHDHDHGG